MAFTTRHHQRVFDQTSILLAPLAPSLMPRRSDSRPTHFCLSLVERVGKRD